MLDVVIIGAGIRGLTAGFYLLKAGRSVLVLDESDRAGGMIRTINEGGYLLEYGPNSLRGDSHELADLISSLNLQGKIISPAISKPNNFIAIGGKLILVPRSLIGLFRTPILSGRSKRQLLREPFNKSRPENPDDESIASFFRRRIGAEAVEVLVKPMMSGIFAGDAEKLSIRSAFPKLWGYEQTYGSIIKGAIRSKKTAKPVLPRMFSFKDGLSTLPDEIRSALGSSVLLNTSVSAIKHNAGSWTIETTGGNSYEAKNIVLTTPLHISAVLLPGDISSKIGKIYSPPISVVHLGYERASIRGDVDGFGFLVAPSERSDILGCIFSSLVFPERAPQGKILFTVLLGGAVNPDITKHSAKELQDIAHKALSKYLLIDATPSFSYAHTIQHSIPQYNIGQRDILQQIKKIESENTGLHFAGSYRGGISIGACVSYAKTVASEIIGSDF